MFVKNRIENVVIHFKMIQFIIKIVHKLVWEMQLCVENTCGKVRKRSMLFQSNVSNFYFKLVMEYDIICVDVLYVVV